MTAVICTAIGFAYDAGSGSKELGHVFSVCYLLGCVLAVLAVAQSGVFTAVIQPPLILFVSVPAAYWLFHGAAVQGLKNILINCGYPLIERFPLMLLTSVTVLLIGVIRWYLGWGAASAGADVAEPSAGVAAKLTSLWSRRSDRDGDDDQAPARPARRPRPERPAHTTRSRAAAPRGTGGRATATRHGRPMRDDTGRPPSERPRRPRPDYERDLPPEPRRRPREPRDDRRDPRQHREGRRSRIEGYEPADSYESPEPRRHRRAPASNGPGPTHHPISQVRYRGESDRDEPRVRRPRKQA